MKHHFHVFKSESLHCAECPCGTSTLVVCGNGHYELWGEADIFLKTLTHKKMVFP